MGFGTELEKNDFKMVIEMFAEQIKNMAQEIENFVQFPKTKVAESLATTCLENSLVFQLDNESIPGINALASSTTSSIALTP